jgi:hypothetical protein
MKKTFSIITAVAVFFAIFPAWAGDNVQAIKKDDPAPFTGLVVKEKRFTELVEAELTATDLRVKLDIQERTSKGIEEVFERRLRQATEPPPWYKTNEFNFWVGFTLGIVVAGAAVYAGVKVVEASR